MVSELTCIQLFIIIVCAIVLIQSFHMFLLLMYNEISEFLNC